MIKLRKKKPVGREKEVFTPENKPAGESNAAYVGAYPGKPWERLTKTRPGKGSRIKILSDEEQSEVVRLARKYFEFSGEDFPGARSIIQKALDNPESPSAQTFFKRAMFSEKRLVVRAYLSNADGRFISHKDAVPLLKLIAASSLDFEIGVIDHYIDNNLKAELVVGDATEIVSENGYWFAHTHPAKRGVTNNILPSTQDIDVMMMTARSYAQHLDKFETEYFVFRDIGASKVQITTTMSERPSQVRVDSVKIEYYFEGDPDDSILGYVNTLRTHLRTRHHLKKDAIIIKSHVKSYIS